MRRAAAVRRRLLFCHNLGGQLPTLPTRQLRPCNYYDLLKLYCENELAILEAPCILKLAVSFTFFLQNIVLLKVTI